MVNLLETAKGWLLGNSIKVTDDWLHACIEWIREENQVCIESLNFRLTSVFIHNHREKVAF